MKVAEDAAQELPLNDERIPVKKNRHVTIALNHINKRLDTLVAKRAAIDKEVDELVIALEALK